MEDKKNGLLAEFNDINAMVQYAIDIIHNREKYEEISVGGRGVT